MAHPLPVSIPEPKYRIGAVVLALIDHHPRYARLEEAHLVAHFVYDQQGVRFDHQPTWEYNVYVLADPVEESEPMVIAERTIFRVIDPAPED